MRSEPELTAERGSSFKLAFLALMAGAASGFIGAGFRLMLRHADNVRDWSLARAHGYGFLGFLFVIVACAFATGLAAWLVRRFSPEATGSGIPHVESEAEGNWSGNPLRIIPVKFMGGAALDRYGPRAGSRGAQRSNGCKHSASHWDRIPMQ
jgi:CIC family chloride channel protein